MPASVAQEASLLGASSRLPILRQVRDWIAQSEKREQPEIAHSDRLLIALLQEQQGGEREMSSSGVPTGVLPTAKCPYSAVVKNPSVPYEFRMPLHYPRYTKAEYERMPEWQIDRLFEEYGLEASQMGSLRDKRDYAIGAFLWN